MWERGGGRGVGVRGVVRVPSVAVAILREESGGVEAERDDGMLGCGEIGKITAVVSTLESGQ